MMLVKDLNGNSLWSATNGFKDKSRYLRLIREENESQRCCNLLFDKSRCCNIVSCPMLCGSDVKPHPEMTSFLNKVR